MSSNKDKFLSHEYETGIGIATEMYEMDPRMGVSLKYFICHDTFVWGMRWRVPLAINAYWRMKSRRKGPGPHERPEHSFTDIKHIVNACIYIFVFCLLTRRTGRPFVFACTCNQFYLLSSIYLFSECDACFLHNIPTAVRQQQQQQQQQYERDFICY